MVEVSPPELHCSEAIMPLADTVSNSMMIMLKSAGSTTNEVGPAAVNRWSFRDDPYLIDGFGRIGVQGLCGSQFSRTFTIM